MIMDWGGSLDILGEGEGLEEDGVRPPTEVQEPVARLALGLAPPSTMLLSSQDTYCAGRELVGELTERGSTGLVSTMVPKELFLDDPLLLPALPTLPDTLCASLGDRGPGDVFTAGLPTSRLLDSASFSKWTAS